MSLLLHTEQWIEIDHENQSDVDLQFAIEIDLQSDADHLTIVDLHEGDLPADGHHTTIDEVDHLPEESKTFANTIIYTFILF